MRAAEAGELRLVGAAARRLHGDPAAFEALPPGVRIVRLAQDVGQVRGALLRVDGERRGVERVQRLAGDVDGAVGTVEIGAVADRRRIAVAGEAAARAAREARQQPDVVVDDLLDLAVREFGADAGEVAEEMSGEVDAVNGEVDDRRAARLGEVVAVARRRRIGGRLLGIVRADLVDLADEAGVDQRLGDLDLAPEALVEADLQHDAGLVAGVDHRAAFLRRSPPAASRRARACRRRRRRARPRRGSGSASRRRRRRPCRDPAWRRGRRRPRPPKSAVIASARERSRSNTATSSASADLVMTGPWLRRMIAPAPTSPILNLRSSPVFLVIGLSDICGSRRARSAGDMKSTSA